MLKKIIYHPRTLKISTVTAAVVFYVRYHS